MPLNVENKTYVAVDDESAIQQTSRIQRKRTSGIKYFFFGLAIILVVSSSVFLVYIFLLQQQQRPTTQPRVVTRNVTIDTATVTTTPPPQTVATTSTAAMPDVKSEKIYTIYIAAYSTEPPAVDDVTRWKNAGFVGTVVPTKKHYRVSLGKFASMSEARMFAEGWTDAFEYGYWIGKL